MHDILQRENEFILEGGWHLYENVEAGLAQLAQKYPLFVVSNCQEGYLQSFNQVTGLVDRCIQDYEYIGRTGKPKAQNIQAIVDRNNLTCPIYIGDTEGDYQAALQAGIDFAHVSYGFGQASNATLVFESFTQLTHHFAPSQ
jgi:phosphoglycolate phosphatase